MNPLTPLSRALTFPLCPLLPMNLKSLPNTCAVVFDVGMNPIMDSLVVVCLQCLVVVVVLVLSSASMLLLGEVVCMMPRKGNLWWKPLSRNLIVLGASLRPLTRRKLRRANTGT